jgi:hypothetical protein
MDLGVLGMGHSVWQRGRYRVQQHQQKQPKDRGKNERMRELYNIRRMEEEEALWFIFGGGGLKNEGLFPAKR